MSDELNMDAERAEDLAAFKQWKGYELPALNNHGQFHQDWLHREFVAFCAGRRRTAPSAPIGEELPKLSIQKIVQLIDEHTDRHFGLIVEPFARAIAKEAVAPYAERIRLLERELAERQTVTVDTDETIAWAAFAENGNVILSSRRRAVVEPVATKYGRPVVPVIAYIDGRTSGEAPEPAKQSTPNTDADSTHDPLYDKAVMIVRAHNRASLSLVQRNLVIGYNRRARLSEAMEANGVVSPCDEKGRRTVLAAAPTPLNSGKEEA